MHPVFLVRNQQSKVRTLAIVAALTDTPPPRFSSYQVVGKQVAHEKGRDPLGDVSDVECEAGIYKSGLKAQRDGGDQNGSCDADYRCAIAPAGPTHKRDQEIERHEHGHVPSPSVEKPI
mgnify:CR=1 FL=1